MAVTLTQFRPFELLSEPPERLYEACETVAAALLFGERPAADDPFERTALMILSNVLMDWVIHKLVRRGVSECEAGIPDSEQQ